MAALAGPASFQALHPKVQRWIWQQGWTELRDAQEAACQPILEGRRDVLLAAATASGKTEAAFLPICSALAGQSATSVQALYLSPLKALINDQFLRLELLCQDLEIPVHRWHGDVPEAQKRRVLQQPAGLLLITPEALEALFVLRGTQLPGLFGGLRYCVVDELHSFLGSVRGSQVQALLHRLEQIRGARIPRIGLSATLGDMKLAASFLRPPSGEGVRVIVSASAAQELKVQVRGYRRDSLTSCTLSMARDLFRLLRGTDNLVFANRRQDVETCTDLLAGLSREASLPQEFWPHHGSLSRELREEVENRLRDRSAPVNVLCTSTLEMGIDVGQVRSVAQIGPPPSVASLRQRLGRSGRRGEPAILRVLVSEPSPLEATRLQTGLRQDLVQSIAMLELLLARWCEAPPAGALNLSTLVQELMSVIAERGGIRALPAWKLLCGQGPFPLSQTRFGGLLKALGEQDILVQSADGSLLLGTRGEKIVNHYTFYTAFRTTEEYRVTCQGRPLGSLPISANLVPGMTLLLAGRRWEIRALDCRAKAIEVVPAPAGEVPTFEGGSAPVDELVRRTMRDVYLSQHVPPYLDAMARELLAEGRQRFQDMGLDYRPLVGLGSGLLLFPWTGDRAMDTMALQVCARGGMAERCGVALRVGGMSPAEGWDLVRELAAGGPPDAVALAASVADPQQDRYDWLLPTELASLNHATRSLDAPAAHRAWQTLDQRLELWGVPEE